MHVSPTVLVLFKPLERDRRGTNPSLVRMYPTTHKVGFYTGFSYLSFRFHREGNSNLVA